MEFLESKIYCKSLLEWIKSDSEEQLYPIEAFDQSVKICESTIEQLKGLGPNANENQYVNVLETYIDEFNKLDEKYNFIETLLREKILDVVT